MKAEAELLEEVESMSGSQLDVICSEHAPKVAFFLLSGHLYASLHCSFECTFTHFLFW